MENKLRPATEKVHALFVVKEDGKIIGRVPKNKMREYRALKAIPSAEQESRNARAEAETEPTRSIQTPAFSEAPTER